MSDLIVRRSGSRGLLVVADLHVTDRGALFWRFGGEVFHESDTRVMRCGRIQAGASGMSRLMAER